MGPTLKQNFTLRGSQSSIKERGLSWIAFGSAKWGLPLGSRIQEFKIADQKTTGEDEILLKARPPRGSMSKMASFNG